MFHCKSCGWYSEITSAILDSNNLYHCYNCGSVDDLEDVIIGLDEGDTCNLNGCCGIIKLQEPKDCSCHISPPCFNCTNLKFECSECGRILE